MNKLQLVLVGNGMAGVRTLEHLLEQAPDAFEITVFGAEPHPNYNRVLLSPVLAGEQTLDEIVLHPLDWYARHGIRLHLGARVTRIDRANRTVHGQDAQGRPISAPYDRLLLATGSRPFVPPVPGSDLAGVHTYRDIADTQAMIAAAAPHRHAVVIGGGVLGLEAASGLARRGMAVTVLHRSGWLMDRQLDPVAAGLLQAELAERGMDCVVTADTRALLPDAHGRVRAVRLADGRELPAELVVIAAGIRPETALAEAAGLQCTGGVVVSDTLQSQTDARIYAVGECASHRGTAYGLVAPVYEQAAVAADHLAGRGVRRYPGSTISTRLKVTGIDLFSAGDFMGCAALHDADTPPAECLELDDRPARGHRRLVVRQGRLIGACLYGDTTDGPWYAELIERGVDVSPIRPWLLFGQAHVPAEALAALGAGHAVSEEAKRPSAHPPAPRADQTAVAHCRPDDHAPKGVGVGAGAPAAAAPSSAAPAAAAPAFQRNGAESPAATC